MNIFRSISILSVALFGLLLSGCGGTAPIISTPVENIDKVPQKFTMLSDAELKIWGQLDLVQDTVPGMSVIKAYDEIIKNRKGTTVVVAVIDGGIDINHEDLKNVMWRNPGEKPGNNKDDDNNGYVDDIHGWNFLGDTYHEQLEYVRLLAKGDISAPRYAAAQAEYTREFNKYSGYARQYEQVNEQFNQADEAVSKYLNKKNYTVEEVRSIKTEDASLKQSVQIISYFMNDYENISEVRESLAEDTKTIQDRLNYHLNKEYKGRKTGDNPDDISDVPYGNNNIRPPHANETHGTMVAGVIAAERNNGIGINGVANNVKIMGIRAVPDGDEYDKDVALGIRYAVDNGAKVVNMSFGKYYSPHSDWTQDAIKYAASKDVLLVISAGNDAYDIDSKITYPNDISAGSTEISDNMISVGALADTYGSNVVADYSNYGRKNVDVFAPGSDIYTTEPNNQYEFVDGTSFASPNVAGVAAMIRSWFPDLTASQVKKVIMDSGLAITPKVVVGGDSSSIKSFGDLSKSGKIVNLYNAMILADKISK
ncbi:S8 family peptidase [Aegicerativicinus sediminis]|uniref:S8 family peptidase n=1 Tax=Aegicerativicinus sediminis TaxID=2893202 RepID=UPI001E2ED326|nr:S8 family peptidase [Aegicerativicinus sediminis]